MNPLNMTTATPTGRWLSLLVTAATLLFAAAANAAAPGITGVTSGTTSAFSLTAQPAYISQPDGQMVTRGAMAARRHRRRRGSSRQPSQGDFATRCTSRVRR